jgi:hypothetical protein
MHCPMITEADLFAHSCLADTLADYLQREIQKAHWNTPIHFTRIRILLKQAYRSAAALSAALDDLERLVGQK